MYLTEGTPDSRTSWQHLYCEHASAPQFMPQTLVQLPDFKVLQAADCEWIAQTGTLKGPPG